MWDWKENIEHCFFTNHLDDHLKEFLNSQKPLSSNEELWEFVFKTAWEWERKHSVDFVRVIMPSFFGQWNISAYWGTFSFPDRNLYLPEEALYWSFLTGWVQDREYGKNYKGKRAPQLPLVGLDWLFQSCFRYPLETCAWLDKRQFLDELKNIYDRAQEELRHYRENRNTNPQWMCPEDSGCSKFFNYYTFCEKHLQNPTIARLNEFEPDKYVWYLIQEDSTLYHLRLCVFG